MTLGPADIQIKIVADLFKCLDSFQFFNQLGYNLTEISTCRI